MAARDYYQGGYTLHDKVSGQESYVATLTELAVLVGVSYCTVRRKMCAGIHQMGRSQYLARPFSEKGAWQEALGGGPARKPYTDLKCTKVVRMDIRDGTLKTYSSIGEAARSNGLEYRNVYQSVNSFYRRDRMGVVSGVWMFRFKADEFPLWSTIVPTAPKTKGAPQPVLLKVLPYGLVVEFKSVSACAQATGLAASAIRRHLKSGEQTTTLAHYLLKEHGSTYPWAA